MRIVDIISVLLHDNRSIRIPGFLAVGVVTSLLITTMPSNTSAQVVLERSVIGSLGGSENLGGDVLEYTAGEGVVKTITGPNVILTQGFHQSGLSFSLSAEVVVTDASCPSASDGAIELINIRGCTPPYDISWSNGKTGAKIDRLTPGVYAYTITTMDCELTGEAEVGPGDPDGCRLRFFNAFSPNGDGENDLWTIENIHLPENSANSVKIFNRWGQELISFTGYDNSSTVWDGSTKKGTALPAGTYFYIAEVAGLLYKGYIELIK